MINKLKRVNYSLFLDVGNSESERFTAETMSKWAMETASLKSDMEIQNAVNMHKQIYISGLFLHLINPDLTKKLSSMLTKDTITEEVLISCLAESGICGASDHGSVDGKEVNAALNLVLSRLDQLHEFHPSGVQNANDEVIKLIKAQSPRDELKGLTRAVSEQSALIQSLGHSGIQAKRLPLPTPDNLEGDMSQRISGVHRAKAKNAF